MVSPFLEKDFDKNKSVIVGEDCPLFEFLEANNNIALLALVCNKDKLSRNIFKLNLSHNNRNDDKNSDTKLSQIVKSSNSLLCQYFKESQDIKAIKSSLDASGILSIHGTKVSSNEKNLM